MHGLMEKSKIQKIFLLCDHLCGQRTESIHTYLLECAQSMLGRHRWHWPPLSCPGTGRGWAFQKACVGDFKYTLNHGIVSLVKKKVKFKFKIWRELKMYWWWYCPLSPSHSHSCVTQCKHLQHVCCSTGEETFAQGLTLAGHFLGDQPGTHSKHKAKSSSVPWWYFSCGLLWVKLCHPLICILKS